jgi:hypothetical protein
MRYKTVILYYVITVIEFTGFTIRIDSIFKCFNLRLHGRLERLIDFIN